VTLSIRARLTLFYTAVLSLVLVAAAVAAHHAYARSRLLRIDAELARVAAQVARVVSADLEEGLPPAEAAHDALEDFETAGRALAVFDGAGVPLSGAWDGLPPPRSGARAGPLSVATPRGAFRIGFTSDRDQPARYHVGVAEPLLPLSQELSGLRNALAGSVLLALLLASAGGWWIARAALLPVSQMAEQARGIDERTPGYRLTVRNTGDELGRLARAFNELLERLESALGQQRQFMADASHELRTPVSVARTAIEVTLARDTRPEAEYRDCLAVVREQMRRLSRLVEAMFTLARADVAGLALEPRGLYLDELIEDCLKEARLLAEPSGVALHFEGASDVEATGDETRLRQMLMNLLQNAVRHSPEGGRVRVELAVEAGSALIKVEDEGEGIPEADRERVFQRFVRLDPSRHGDGAGLGLPIARAIAEAHGGQLVLEPGTGLGSRFLIRLPRVPRPPRPRPALVPVLLAGALSAPAVTAPAADAADDARPRLLAGALPPLLQLDGALDEPAWAAAESASDLVMVEPREGGPPTGRTVFKVLANSRALVFGIRCLDPDPGGIVSFTKERDGDFENEDHVVILLDPFQDGRSGYVFAVNPGAARLDALVEPGGEDIDTNWDGEWEAATRRDGEGWSAEIRIPINTLSFKQGRDEWGMNVQRRVQRLQETARWASARQDYTVFQSSRAGLLAGLPAFELGLGLGVRPSLVSGFQNPAPGVATDGTLQPSLDVTKRLGSNALVSLSVNTDFAETEVDTRQTNLTRFPLFFPEKRTFFLESADIFSFGIGIGEEALVPFFSRRIGLVSGREVPILSGLKASGRAGETSFGGLLVRTRDEPGLAPATTMGVVRLKQNLFEESRAGVLASFGDPLGRAGSWQLGADFVYQTSRFRGDKNFIAGVWGLAAGRDDLDSSGERTAFGFKVDYPNDLWDCFAIYRRIGDRFDPSLGFVPRPGSNTYFGGCTFAPRPSGSFIRQMFHRLYANVTTDLRGRWESYEVPIAPLSWRLESGDRAGFEIELAGERLVEPFEISDGLELRAAPYHWRRYQLEVESAAKRKLAVDARFEFGSFYTGRLQQLEVEAIWTPSPLVTLIAEAEHDRGRLAEGSFDVTLVGTKIRLNLSPNLQLNSFLQYDTDDDSFGTNTRLRWTFHPRGDLFVIYNHNLRSLDDRWHRESNGLLVKMQYTFRR
jgi:heavy metal sensor kinase